MRRPRVVPPVALLLGSVAYIYNTFNNIAELRGSKAIANTTYGEIRGAKNTARNGRVYFEFLGIPYASPPVGHLRFEPPVLPEKWYGVREALRFGPRCWQFERFSRTVQGDEDCLFLNVFTHQILNEEQVSQANLRPVMVFIHGGAFMAGLSNFYRPKYFMAEDIVLVTFNYRLASFGFLNTGDEVVRGNMGLKDQAMALRWVQDNIHFFGGDKTRVTLMGESAGAASVHLHTLSPLSTGLFHRGISQSGSALNPWAITQKPKEQAELFGRKLNCPTDTSQEMVTCLKFRSARSIARTHIDYTKSFIGDRLALFSPSVESVNDSSAFLIEHPRQLLKEGRVANPVPWIVGVNSEEGLIYAATAIKNKTRRRMVNENWNKIAPLVFYYEEEPYHQNISSRIRRYYFDNNKIGMSTLEETVNMFSDREFFEGFRDSVELQSKVAPVYPYYYSYKGNFGFANLLFSMTGSLPASLDTIFAFVANTREWFRTNVFRLGRKKHYGVCHADELPIFYNIPLITREIAPGSKDYPFSSALIQVWSKFAKDGDPSLFGNVNWDRNDPAQTLRVMRLDDYPRMMIPPFVERLDFWKSLNIGSSSKE